MRQTALGAVEENLGVRNSRPDRFAGAMALAGEGKGTVECDAEAVGSGVAAGEDLSGAVRADCVGTRRAVTDLVDAFYTFHGVTISLVVFADKDEGVYPIRYRSITSAMPS